MAAERPEEWRQLYKDAVQLLPGLYRRPDGSAIWNLTEILEHYGLADNDENRRALAAEIEDEMKRKGSVDIIVGGLD